MAAFLINQVLDELPFRRVMGDQPERLVDVAAAGLERIEDHGELLSNLVDVPVRLIPDLGLPSSAAQPLEVVWPDGLVLRIPTPCDACTLREVFHLLAATLSSQSPAC
jgi:hypothetical protein